MEKKVRRALIVLSVVILLLGVCNVVAVEYRFLHGSMLEDGLWFDGTNFAGLLSLFSVFLGAVLGFGVMLCYVLAAAAMWGVYGLARLIRRYAGKRRGPPQQ